jgi:hypothetical protein
MKTLSAEDVKDATAVHTENTIEFASHMTRRLVERSMLDYTYDKSGKLKDSTFGWMRDECDFLHLLDRLAWQVCCINDLIKPFINGGGKEKYFVADDDIAELVKQCADTANFAMMIAQRASNRTKKLIEPLGGFFVE